MDSFCTKELLANVCEVEAQFDESESKSSSIAGKDVITSKSIKNSDNYGSFSNSYSNKNVKRDPNKSKSMTVPSFPKKFLNKKKLNVIHTLEHKNKSNLSNVSNDKSSPKLLQKVSNSVITENVKTEPAREITRTDNTSHNNFNISNKPLPDYDLNKAEININKTEENFLDKSTDNLNSNKEMIENINQSSDSHSRLSKDIDSNKTEKLNNFTKKDTLKTDDTSLLHNNHRKSVYEDQEEISSVDIYEHLKQNVPHECDNTAIPEETPNTGTDQKEIQAPSTQNMCLLSSWDLPEEVLKRYQEVGVESMFQWQVECICSPGVLEGKNLVFSAPTSAGKTLVAEIILLKNILERKKKGIFIVPFVSVAKEKTYNLQRLFGLSGVRVEGFMGSQSPPGGFQKTDIAVCTIEKANNIINRLIENGGVDDLGIIVVDEIHMVGDPQRGYLLELLLTKLQFISSLYQNLKIQVIGMSATLPNVHVLARWQNAILYTTDFRPVPLQQMVKVGSTLFGDDFVVIKDLDSSDLKVKGDSDHLVQLCLETLLEGYSVLVFCPTKAWCEKIALSIASSIFNIGKVDSAYPSCLSVGVRGRLDAQALQGVINALKACPAGLDSVLERSLSFGTSFHHAGLTFDERDIIECGFRSGVIPVLVATSTLSSGVNLPARRVIIRSPNTGGSLLDPLVYQQMIGRAGRKGKDSKGESILMCNQNERGKAERLINATLPPIRSCLQSNSSLSSSFKRAILEIVASGAAKTMKELTRYWNCSLLAASSTESGGPGGIVSEGSASDPAGSIKNCVSYLIDNELARMEEREGETWLSPTQLGSAILASGLSPDEGVAVFRELERARQCFVLVNELHVVYQVTPIYISGAWPNMDWLLFLELWESLPEDMKKVGELVGVTESFIVHAMKGTVNTKVPRQRMLLSIHQRFFAALSLHDLVHEVSLKEVVSKYKTTKGLLQALQQSAATFAGMVAVFCNRLRWFNMEILIEQYQKRLHFGIQRELCDLIRIPILNGSRARTVFEAGLETVHQVAHSDPGTLADILRKSCPFQSLKSNQSQTDVGFIINSDGNRLSFAEAGLAIVVEARNIVQKELGFENLDWTVQFSKDDVPRASTEENQSNLHTPQSVDLQLRLSDSDESSSESSNVPVNQHPEPSNGPLNKHSSEPSNGPVNEHLPEPSIVPMNQHPPEPSNGPVNQHPSEPIAIEQQSLPKHEDVLCLNEFENREMVTDVNDDQEIQAGISAMDSSDQDLFLDSFIQDSPTERRSESVIKFENQKICDSKISDLSASKNLQNFGDKRSPKFQIPKNRFEKFNEDSPKSYLSDSLKEEFLNSIREDPSPNSSKDGYKRYIEEREDTNINLFNRRKSEIGKSTPKYEALSYTNIINITQEDDIEEREEEIININLFNKKKSYVSKSTPKRDCIMPFANTINRKIGKTPLYSACSEEIDFGCEIDNGQDTVVLSSSKLLQDHSIDVEQDDVSEDDTVIVTESGVLATTRQEIDDDVNKFEVTIAGQDDSFGLDSNSFYERVFASFLSQETCEINDRIVTKMDRGNGIVLNPEKYSLNCDKSYVNKDKSDMFSCNANIIHLSNDCDKESNKNTLDTDKTCEINKSIIETKTKGLKNTLFRSSKIMKMDTNISSVSKIETNKNLSDESPNYFRKESNNTSKMSNTSGNPGNVDLTDIFRELFPSEPNRNKTSKTKSNTTGHAGKVNPVLDSYRRIFPSEIYRNDQRSVIVLDVTRASELFDIFLNEWTHQEDFALSLCCLKVQNDQQKRGIGGRMFAPPTKKPSGSSKSGLKIERTQKVLSGISVSWDGRCVYYIDFGEDCEADGYSKKARTKRVSLTTRLESVKQRFSKTGKGQILKIWRAKHVLKTLFLSGIHVPPGTFEDPAVVAWMLNPDSPELDLERLVKSHVPGLHDLFTNSKTSKSLLESLGLDSNASEDVVRSRRASAIECVSLCRIAPVLSNKLKKSGLWDSFVQVEMPCCYALALVELKGLGFSEDECRTQKELLQARMEILEREAFRLAGRRFSISSPDQVAKIIYDELRLDTRDRSTEAKVTPNRRRNSATRCTAKETLERLSHLHPLPAVIIEWRRIQSALTQVVFPLLDGARTDASSESRLFPVTHSFTCTGRVTFHSPNVQFVPKDFDIELPLKKGTGVTSERTEPKVPESQTHTISLRRTIISGLGRTLLSADYNQLELRILAHFSMDKLLVRSLRKGEDIFTSISSQIHGIPEVEVTSAMRQTAKKICYGIIYGMGDKTLSDVLGSDERAASDLMDKFHQSFPGIRQFIQRTVEEVKKNGFVTTKMGRKRFLPAIHSPIPLEKSQAERQAVNTKIQGTASDIVKRAMLDIQKCLSDRSQDRGSEGAFLILQLHDELVYEVSCDELPYVAKIVRLKMEAQPLSVPLTVSVKVGPTWGNLEPF